MSEEQEKKLQKMHLGYPIRDLIKKEFNIEVSAYYPCDEIFFKLVGNALDYIDHYKQQINSLEKLNNRLIEANKKLQQHLSLRYKLKIRKAIKKREKEQKKVNKIKEVK